MTTPQQHPPPVDWTRPGHRLNGGEALKNYWGGEDSRTVRERESGAE